MPRIKIAHTHTIQKSIMAERETSHRREFLQGKSAVRALRDVAQGAEEELGGASLVEPGSRESYLVQVTRDAMACQFAVILNVGQYPEGTEAALAALDLVDQLEDQLSVYRPHSELSRLNDRAAAEPVVVEPRMFALLELAAEIWRETGGAFDMTTGPLSRAWGFFKRQGRLPQPEELEEALVHVGTEQVTLDVAECSVAFAEVGVEVNVNGIGKGYALDRAGEVLRESGVVDFLLHGGQSSVLAGGARGSRHGRGWTVGLRHPLRPERRLAEFYLRDRALGTSGSATQFFHFGGKRYGHVIDPRSGMPVEGVYSATVTAPTAAQADALATAFYVLGPAEARRYCDSHDGIACALVTGGPRQGSIEIHTAGLAQGDWRLLDDAA
ncbi:MAG: FAD:protein FMN transferase [Pirellulales bacterium]